MANYQSRVPETTTDRAEIPSQRYSFARSTTEEGRNQRRAVAEHRKIRGLLNRAYSAARRAAHANRRSPRGNFQHYENMLAILDEGAKRGIQVGGVDRAKRIEQQVLSNRERMRNIGASNLQLHQASGLGRTTPEPEEPAPVVEMGDDSPSIQEEYKDAQEVYGEVYDPYRNLLNRSLIDTQNQIYG